MEVRGRLVGSRGRAKVVVPRLGLIAIAALVLSGCILTVHTSLTRVGTAQVFAGELANRGPEAFLGHDVRVEFLDSAGSVVDTKVVPGCLHSLQAGASDFFDAQSAAPAGSIAAARARVNFDAALSLGNVALASMTISGVSLGVDGDTVAVTGSLTNSGSSTLSDPTVCAVLRTNKNDVVRVSSQTLAPLIAGGVRMFTVSLTANAGSLTTDHIDIWADGVLDGTPISPSSSLGYTVQAPGSPGPSACAFRQTPITYEGPEDRAPYLRAMELAGYNMLFPGDGYFSQPQILVGTRANRLPLAGMYAPPTLLKAIGWIESDMSQGAPSLPWAAIGPALVAFDCGFGISQVTSGMTVPLGEAGEPTDQQALVATDFAYNIARGASILVDKWNAAPANRPIVGIDTNSDPSFVENWYYAVWSYNGFTGPGSNRSNHPLDPLYGSWPRTPFSCGSASDGLSHNRSLYPYQELVYGCLAHRLSCRVSHSGLRYRRRCRI